MRMKFISFLYVICIPRITLQNAISYIAPFTLRTLLYGIDDLDLNENMGIINETLKLIAETKQGLSNVLHI